MGVKRYITYRLNNVGLVRIIHIILFCLFSVIFIANCSYLGEYQKAQTYFNIAVEADNRQKFLTEDPARDMASLSNIHTNYTLAYKYISQTISKNSKKLKADGLFGGALTIKALCEWKLRKYDSALMTSQEALSYLRAEAGVPNRDLALMIAMPGLIKADQAYAHTMPLMIIDPKYQSDLNSGNISVDLRKEFANNGIELSQNIAVSVQAEGSKWLIDDRGSGIKYHARQEEDLIEIYSSKPYNEIADMLQGAIRDINSAQRTVDKNHPVQTYLQISKLAIYRTWQVAIEKKIENPDEREAKRTSLREDIIKPELDTLKNLLTEAENDTVYLYWCKILGVTP